MNKELKIIDINTAVRTVVKPSEFQFQTIRHTNHNGNNGIKELWVFLLELLLDKSHRGTIKWLKNAQFRIENKERLSKLWEKCKDRKIAMSYDKLSRSLRYYKGGKILAKIKNRNFEHEFICDLEKLIGLKPNEIVNLTSEK